MWSRYHAGTWCTSCLDEGAQDSELHGGNCTPNTPKWVRRPRAIRAGPSDERAWRAGGYGDFMGVEVVNVFTTGGRARQTGGEMTIGDVNR